ncbi:MAG: TIGR03009 domain-containing protein [Planctomycetaceae bacterium]|nr:TIGR03009 domain-containing protein [Planctomycetaceae bacterium]
MRLLGRWIGVTLLVGSALPVWAQVPATQPAPAGPAAPQYAPQPGAPTQYAPPQGAPVQGTGVPQVAALPGNNLQPGAAGGAPLPVQAPFLLSDVEQKFLDQLLVIWERESDKIQLFKSDFRLYEYDATWNPAGVAQRICMGEVRYSKPDKGFYEIKAIHAATPTTDPARQNDPDMKKRFDYPLSEEMGEKWICDGKAIFEFAATKKQVIERRLPPELMGKAISDGPLPFVFGVEAEKLKKRYWLRVITPQGEQATTWIEAYPKFRADASNYQRIEIILRNQDLMPQAVQVFMPNNLPDKKVSKVYMFENPQANGVLATIGNFMGIFVKPQLPLGWQWIVDDPAAGQTPPPQPAQAATPKTNPFGIRSFNIFAPKK